jgi:hypothetical protein
MRATKSVAPYRIETSALHLAKTFEKYFPTLGEFTQRDQT